VRSPTLQSGYPIYLKDMVAGGAVVLGTVVVVEERLAG
jgi:hypothetical protein